MLNELEKLETRKQVQNDLVEMRNANVCDELVDTLTEGASNPGAKIHEDLVQIHDLWRNFGR